MCLDTVKHIYKRPNKKVVTAWAVFDVDGDGYLFEFQPHRGTYTVATGEWLQVEVPILILPATYEDDYYPAGFHKFASRAAAIDWAVPNRQKVVKVKLRKVLARGTQRRHEVLVAQEMYVPNPRRKRQ